MPPLPDARGKLTEQGRLDNFTWFRTGGPADWLFEPADVEDLSAFLKALPSDLPVTPIGVGSNMIIRSGGVAGVVVRLSKAFAKVEVEGECRIRSGGRAMGIQTATAARDAGIAGLEFLSGIPGTAGGAVRMNAGAYEHETADILVEATIVRRDGTVAALSAEELGFRYRHSNLGEGDIVVEALFEGRPGDPVAIGARMEEISEKREATQPTRTQTGGSTFKNPEGGKAWQLVDAAGCRGFEMNGAQVSEKHTNFLINTGAASGDDIETLGEEVRRRVKANSGVELEWEIERIGRRAAE
ncbi:UDP-N-acetylenolpyruvoylglucosamine reductase [Pacificimonas flava]|uniref:UDP-N-acetylenolpyruvoylglucosamine reductase n=2 Tax=Pacificimonas TaxID=1960290 RepID=A0A219B669_9SPHN|nr:MULTISPECIES: UDP-N-acetylmuramate dehydrogenase [Pacificimonas]MBZ6378903.1 UDP-N-acetylmuramate dehydrogenase [Pacificimonas aurantium]OWV33845.1 UDP-N-acetylenolpyruvoylglucosamine reductase [Pacificimonas flava]